MDLNGQAHYNNSCELIVAKDFDDKWSLSLCPDSVQNACILVVTMCLQSILTYNVLTGHTYVLCKL